MLEILSAAPRFNRWMADTIRPYVGQRVVEIGAGIGNLSAELSQERTHYLATDVDRSHVSRLNSRLGNASHIGFECLDLVAEQGVGSLAGRFDTAICLNVLEHVKDDGLGLANIRSLLSEGGRAIVLVPQDMRVFGTLDEVLGHFRRYSEEELRAKMATAGFAVESMLHFNRISRPGWFFTGRILKKRTLSRFQIFCFDHLVWLWRIVDRLLPWPATSLIAIGTKR